MNKSFREFVEEFRQSDFTSWQKQVAREYLEIGESKTWGAKHCGSDAEHEGSKYIARKLEEIGVDNVELIEVPTDRCQFNDATITFPEGRNEAIKPYCCVSAGTPVGGIDAEIVDCGYGTRDEIDAVDVTGKIVILCNDLNITEANPFITVSLLHLQELGAAAALIWVKGVDPDTRSAAMNPFAVEMPVASVSPEEAALLKETEGKVHLVIDCEIIPDGGTSYEVVGEIYGSACDERILYTAHLDHYFKCLQDNVSAVVTNLGIAKAMIDLGYKPNRTITFVFNASHELGHVLSTSPDLKGPYELFVNKRPDIPAKAIADINFEYTAMTQNELRSITSYETAHSYLDYQAQMPDVHEGFIQLAQDIRSEDYFLLTWCDAIISIISGVPVYMNDAIADQIYSGDSPYMGRDHSNKDTWDIFSAEALRTETFWYGCLGAYIDSKPYMEMDYSKRMEFIAFNDEETALLERMGVSIDDFNAACEAVKEAGEKLYNRAKAANEDNGTITEETVKENEAILDANRKISECTDHFMANLITTLAPKHKVYCLNAGMMTAARDMLISKDFNGAVGLLCAVDIAGLSYQFDGEYVDYFAELIDGKNATWTKDRTCKCFPMKDLMTALKRKGTGASDYTSEIELLDQQIRELQSLLEKQIQTVTDTLHVAEEKINKCLHSI